MRFIYTSNGVFKSVSLNGSQQLIIKNSMSVRYLRQVITYDITNE